MGQVGRPKETLDSLPENWEEVIIQLYKEGGSDEEAKAIIAEMRGTFSNDLWERWMLDEPKFSEAIKSGRMFAQGWWMHKGRKSLENPTFSYTGWYMNMKNRFGWRDKTSTEHTGKIESTQITYIQQSGNEPIKES
jgi:hypothetical protein